MSVPTHSLIYLDAFAGISGDMFLGALLDLGYPLVRMRQDLASLGVDGIRLSRRRVTRGGLAATQACVATAGGQPQRGRREIRRILKASRLPGPVRSTAREVFERLIDVEARLHDTSPEKVHLHEVGALDALADVVGSVAALHAMGVRTIRASRVNVGSGTVHCAHGELPVPTPATAELLHSVPVYAAGEGERTTPTGAALLAVLATGFGPLPAMTIAAIGHGAGSTEPAGPPNLLRILAGEAVVTGTEEDGPDQAVVELRCQLDDAEPRLLGHVAERLLDAGALDTYLSPVQMKKGRPGVLLVALATREVVGNLGRIVLDETPTLGYRLVAVERVERPRQHQKVSTNFGEVRMKVAGGDGRVPVATPEYDDCRRLARRHQVPLREVLAAARAAWDRHQRRRKR